MTGADFGSFILGLIVVAIDRTLGRRDRTPASA